MPKKPARTCYESAIEILTRRDYAIKELKTKLTQKGFGKIAVEETVQELLALKYLNDAKYAINRACYRAEVSKWGAQKIKQELMKNGLAEAHITAALEALEVDNFKETAQQLIERKYKPLPQDATPEDRQKYKKRQLNFLLRRGFSYEEAKMALGESGKSL